MISGDVSNIMIYFSGSDIRISIDHTRKDNAAGPISRGRYTTIIIVLIIDSTHVHIRSNM